MVKICGAFLVIVFLLIPYEGMAKGKKKKGRRKPPPEQLEDPDPRLPSWPVPAFSLGVSPITGFRLRSDTVGDIEVNSAYGEFGLGASLAHIPVVPVMRKNPGLQLSLAGGYSRGYLHSETIVGEDDPVKQESAFQRISAGPLVTYYHKFFRYRLEITRGVISYDEDVFDDLHQLAILNEPGLLLRTWWQVLFTTHYRQSWTKRASDPLLTELDLWLHSLMQFEPFDFYVDFGPGTVLLEQKVGTGNKSLSAQYAKLGLGMTLIWKVKASFVGRYIYQSSKEVNDAFAGADKLNPTQDIQTADNLGTLPEDSADVQLFIGVPNLFFGIGFGWQMRQTIYNAAGIAGERRTISEQGYGVTFSMAL